MDVFVVSGHRIRGYAMSHRYTILPFLAPWRSSSDPDEMVATGSRVDGQPFTFRGSAPKKKALDLEHSFLFMSAAEAVVRTWRNGNVTYTQGSFDILLAPVTSSLTVSSENAQVCLNRGNGAAEDNRAGVITEYIFGWKMPSIFP